MINALSVDVEDYFQVNAFASHIRHDQWDNYPLRVEENTHLILDMLDRFSTTATFFILGWVAERLPHLTKEIHHRGHEVACHGYNHELIYSIGAERFRADIRRAKRLLEDQCGEQVNGYRAPSYSITAKSLWALNILVEEGFSYDSSIFPVIHDTYGIPGAHRFPSKLQTDAGPIMEFPLTTLPFQIGWKKLRIPIAGGGYLRLLPVGIIRRGIEVINQQEFQPAVLYFHPWELDPQQPRINASLKSRFRHYLNLHSTECKLEYLFERLQFAPMKTVLAKLGGSCA